MFIRLIFITAKVCKGVPSGGVLKTMNPKSPTIIIKTLKLEN